jgi:hypothetical protein
MLGEPQIPPALPEMTRSMEDKNYFGRMTKEYQAASAYSGELYRGISRRLNGLLFGTVVDFGNGGIINYDITAVDKVICVDIINTNRELTNNKVDFIYGDFYECDMKVKADCILAQFLFHHLTDEPELRLGLKEARSMLNQNGRMIVVEIGIPEWAEKIQFRARRLLFALLSFMKKPCLRFFSVRSLVRLLEDTGFNNLRTQYIPIGKRVSPAPVLFPNLRLPGRLYPFKCLLIEASL